jgi:hypothetical protein
MAPRAHRMTVEERMTRSRQLALVQQLLYRSVWSGANANGEQVFTVPSRSVSGRQHTVLLRPTGTWHCTCPAWSWGLPCGHVGAAAHHWEQIEQAMSEAGQRANERYHALVEYIEQQEGSRRQW